METQNIINELESILINLETLKDESLAIYQIKELLKELKK